MLTVYGTAVTAETGYCFGSGLQASSQGTILLLD